MDKDYIFQIKVNGASIDVLRYDRYKTPLAQHLIYLFLGLNENIDVNVNRE